MIEKKDSVLRREILPLLALLYDECQDLFCADKISKKVLELTTLF